MALLSPQVKNGLMYAAGGALLALAFGRAMQPVPTIELPYYKDTCLSGYRDGTLHSTYRQTYGAAATIKDAETAMKASEAIYTWLVVQNDPVTTPQERAYAFRSACNTANEMTGDMIARMDVIAPLYSAMRGQKERHLYDSDAYKNTMLAAHDNYDVTRTALSSYLPKPVTARP